MLKTVVVIMIFVDSMMDAFSGFFDEYKVIKKE